LQRLLRINGRQHVFLKYEGVYEIARRSRKETIRRHLNLTQGRSC
jgi:hypothetical protein